MLSLTLTAAYALLLSPLPPRAHTAGGPRCVSEPPDTIEERTTTPSAPAPPPLRTPAPLAADAPPLAPPPQTPPPSSFPVAPQLTLSKYETMQGRRVRAVLAYAPAFAPLAAEVTAALGNALPDVKVQRVAAAPEDPRVPSISLRVDGVLCTSSTEPGRLYLPLSRIGVVVERARRKRRPKGDAYTSAAGRRATGETASGWRRSSSGWNSPRPGTRRSTRSTRWSSPRRRRGRWRRGSLCSTDADLFLLRARNRQLVSLL